MPYRFPTGSPIRLLLLAVLLASVAGPSRGAASDPDAIARGAYLFAAADCGGCHTDRKHNGAPLAGGRALSTPFGVFYSPNITPDRNAGIGAWSLDEFRRALRVGIRPDGAALYPVFPFTSFTGMSDADIADLYAYVMVQPPSPVPDKPHAARVPFGWRRLLWPWQALFFRPGPLAVAPGRDTEWNRGRYLVEAVAHCGECHSPRNWLGAVDRNRAYAGNPTGPDGQKAPNITPDPATGIGKWSLDDIETLLKTGQTPDYDYVGSGMGEVVRGTAELSDDDRQAIAVYLKSLPARRATGK